MMRQPTHESTARLHSLLMAAPYERLRPVYERHGVTKGGPVGLADEICLDGANTLASVFRGRRGVPYIEVVRDVAQQLHVSKEVRQRDHDDETKLEVDCLEEVIRKYLAKASTEERERVAEVLRKAGRDFNDLGKAAANGALTSGTLLLLVKGIGKRATAAIVERIVLLIVGRTAAREAAKRAAQIAGYAVPVLNAVMIAWTVIDLAGPAFRKTVPTVLEVALLRMESDEGEVPT